MPTMSGWSGLVVIHTLDRLINLSHIRGRSGHVRVSAYRGRSRIIGAGFARAALIAPGVSRSRYPLCHEVNELRNSAGHPGHRMMACSPTVVELTVPTTWMLLPNG